MGEEQIARLHHVELICKKMPWFEDLELTGEGGLILVHQFLGGEVEWPLHTSLASLVGYQ